MTSFRLVKSETVPLTRDLAELFRNMEPSPTEREFSASRLKRLQEKAMRGSLVTFNWVTAAHPSDGRMIRMNGQHSSRMLCELNGSFPEGLMAHVDHYEVENESALAILFRQFDDRRSGRSSADVSGAYQGLQPGLRDISRPVAKMAIEGVAWQRWNVEGLPTPSGDDVYDLFNAEINHPFLRWMGEFFSSGVPAELKRVPVAAAMYATFVANDTEARSFWRSVADGGVEYVDDAPATVLAEGLKLLKENKDPRKAVKNTGVYHGAIYAWNAHREGKRIRTVRYDTPKGKPMIMPVR